MSTTASVAEHVPTWSLGDKLRKARRDAKVSTSGMAGRLGCHRNSVLGWETDKTVPSLEVVVRWSRVTHVPLSWFLEDFDPASTTWYSDHSSVPGLLLAA